MKTEAFDYLLSAIVITLLTSIALAGAALGSWGLTRHMLGVYHVLADALLFLLVFGLA